MPALKLFPLKMSKTLRAFSNSKTNESSNLLRANPSSSFSQVFLGRWHTLEIPVSIFSKEGALGEETRN